MKSIPHFINLSIFWKCFITYLISTLIFLGVQLYSYNKTASLWQESYAAQIESSLVNNAQALSNDLSNLYYFPKTMNLSDEFRELKRASEISSTEHSRYISKIMHKLSNQISFFRLSDVIIHFQKSDICVTPHSFYMSLDKWSTHYPYNNTDITRVVTDKEAENTSLEMLSSDLIEMKGVSASEYVTCVMKESSDSCTYIFLIEKERIFDYFQLSSLPEKVYFQICDVNGNILLDYDSANAKGDLQTENFITFTADIPAVNASASISLPQSYFKSVTHQAHRVVNTVLFLSLFLGLTLSIIFSWMNTRPIQTLIQLHQIPKEKQSKNEFVTIYNHLLETKEQQRSMRDKLLLSLLIKAFSGLPVCSDDFAEISGDNIPFPMPARIAVAKCRISQEIQSLLLYQLKENMPSDFLIEPLNNQEIGLVFPAEDEAIFKLKNYLDEINHELKGEAQIICGVSAPFTSFDEINNTVRQARFSIPTNNGSFVIFNADDSPFAPKIPIPDYREFQNALFNWNIKKADSLLTEYADAVTKQSNVFAQEVFYTLLATIRSAADTVNIFPDLFNEISYNRNISNDSNILSLKLLTNCLFEAKSSNQFSKNELRNREVIHYIDTHFSDPVLSASVVAEIYHCSEKTINTIVSQKTGTSFANYLTTVRMQKAADMLTDSSQEVAAVAEECGLTLSTFYRNFKKQYQMTPAEYKAQFSGSSHNSM